MVKHGYKQTEIGVIPEDWEVRRLRETGTFFSTNSLSRDKLNYNNGTFYNIHYGDIHTQFKSHFNIQNEIVPFINNDIKPSTINLCKKGDLIIADASENEDDIGKAIEIINDGNKNIVAGLHTLHFRPFNDVFYEGFLGHLWKTELMHLNILKEAQGTKVLGISVSRLLDLQIPLPPLAEQEAIASALSDADAWIESLEQLIAKKRLIKQGAMQELLTPPDGTVSGVEPWEVKTLGEVGKTFGGLSGKTKADFGKGNACYIPFMNVMKNVVIDNSFFEKVNLKQGEVQSKVLKNDLLFNGSSETPEELGISSVLLEDIDGLYLNSFCFGFRLFDVNINPLLLSYLFRSPYGRKIVFYLAQGATRYNLSKTNFMELEIAIPKSLSEQTRIAAILSDMDAELEALEQKLSKARQIKQGMMQELLTGRVRLV